MLNNTKLRGSMVLLLCCFAVACSMAARGQNAPEGKLDITVTDQNGQPLASAVVLVQQNGKTISQVRTTPSGRQVLDHIPAGECKVTVQREGFYNESIQTVQIPAGATMPVEVHLQPVREYHEEVEVRAQSSPIDPQQIAGSHGLNAEGIATIPYPSTRDYRNVLPYIPGVLADSGGQIHVAGSSTQQVQDYLDGFEVSQPASGALGVRLNPDSLRRIDVLNTRYSARFGKGSGGLTNLEVQDGDNRYRFNATDFIPTLQTVKGIHLNNWTPRAYFSGPVIKDRLWFDISHEGENDLTIIKELPDGGDSSNQWRTADLARLRLNVTPGNVATASALINMFDGDNEGISARDPISVSTNQHASLKLFTLKDQLTVARSTLLEFGAGYHQNNSFVQPQGLQDYLITPATELGNFYLRSDAASSRVQGFANLYLRPWSFLGKHQLTLGGMVDRVIFNGQATRGPIQFLDGGGNLLRDITFANAPRFSLNTLEPSAFLEDRWSVRDRVSIEAGARWDHDSFLGQDVYSPRIAGTAMLNTASETKLSAGIGIYYDRTNLFEVSQAFQGPRVDTFHCQITPQDTCAPGPPVITVIPANFTTDPSQLTLPRFVNWSVGLERRLPGQVYARVDFLSRHGSNVWAFEPQPSGVFALGHQKTDRYDGAQLTLRKEFKRGYPFMVSYTRSRARSNESVDFGIDNFTTGAQAAGPLPWDAPNQVTSWGSTPLPSFWKFKDLDLAYSLLWHSGYPFPIVNNVGQIVAPPGSLHTPDFFTLNPAIEKKFTFHHYRWAMRVGIENITNSSNALFVDNNRDSNTFREPIGQAHRTLNGRIRLLGKQ